MVVQALTPYLEDPDVTLYQGDAGELLPALPASSVDACITSPPYWGLRDYGTATWEGGDEECSHEMPASYAGGTESSKLSGWDNSLTERDIQAKAMRRRLQYAGTCALCGATRADAQLGLEEEPEEYVERLVLIFREVRRVLADHGVLWLNLGDTYTSGNRAYRHPGRLNPEAQGMATRAPTPASLKQKELVGIPWRVAFALQADGWWLRSDVIWSKPNTMPESVLDRPTKAHEYVFLLSKGKRYYYDQEAVRERFTDPHLRSNGRGLQGGAYAPPGQTPHGNARASGSAPSSEEPKPEGLLELEPRAEASGRQQRSVWEIPTQPYRSAHFATYPEELVRRALLASTSEAGVCSTCGAPWQRVLEAERLAPATIPGNRLPHRVDENLLSSSVGGRRVVSTVGWQATCTCEAEPRPALVLDPFGGSGTTGLVARKHGRRALLLELSPEYCALAAERLQQLSLLAEEA